MALMPMFWGRAAILSMRFLGGTKWIAKGIRLGGEKERIAGAA
jgi:hypothetical protein